MRTVHSRRAAFTLAVTGALLGTCAAAPVFAATTSVSGIVFQDLNDNGTRDAGESPQADVEVTLRGPGGTLTTRSGPDGRYAFNDVVAGTHQVGASNTFDLRAVPVTVDSTPVTQDVSAYGGWVRVQAFDDTDRDGLRGPGEQGLAGIRVTVSSGGTEVTTVPTNEVGEATVMVSRTGVYRVEATAPDGKRITSPNPAEVTVTDSGGGTADIGIGQVRNVDVPLFTYLDRDGNGAANTPDDRGTPVRYTIRPTDGGTPVEGTTGGDGTATRSLPEGTYEVTVTPPEGYVATRPGPVRYTVVADGTPPTVTLGITEAAEYRGVVYIDSNDDTDHDADEPLVEGATVELVGPRATYQATTDDKGAYLVTGILPDAYRVTVTLPDRYDGMVNGLTHSSQEQFAAGQKLETDHRVTGKAAATEPGRMTGRIFIDANENRRFDAGETPLTGTTVTLTGADGRTHTTTVDASGAYSLTGLPAGVYQVTVTVADAYRSRVSDPTYTSTVTIRPGEATEADFFITRAVPGVGGTTPGTGGGTTPSATDPSRSTPAATTAARTSRGLLARTGEPTDARTAAALGLIGLGAALLAWRRRRLA